PFVAYGPIITGPKGLEFINCPLGRDEGAKFMPESRHEARRMAGFTQYEDYHDLSPSVWRTVPGGTGTEIDPCTSGSTLLAFGPGCPAVVRAKTGTISCLVLVDVAGKGYGARLLSKSGAGEQHDVTSIYVSVA